MKTCEQLRKLTSDTATLEDKIAMLHCTMCWSNNVLALVKNKKKGFSNGKMQIGVILDQHVYDKKWIVKFENMYNLPTLYQDYIQLPGKEYKKPEDIFLDGWEID